MTEYKCFQCPLWDSKDKKNYLGVCRAPLPWWICLAERPMLLAIPPQVECNVHTYITAKKDQ